MELYQVLLLIAIILELVYIHRIKKSKVSLFQKKYLLIFLAIILILMTLVFLFGSLHAVDVMMSIIRWGCTIIGVIGILYYGLMIMNSLIANKKE